MLALHSLLLRPSRRPLDSRLELRLQQKDRPAFIAVAAIVVLLQSSCVGSWGHLQGLLQGLHGELHTLHGSGARQQKDSLAHLQEEGREQQEDERELHFTAVTATYLRRQERTL